MDTDFIPLELDDEFRFACSPEVPCFNQCCRDINQYLTPYDIYRLKNRLNMTSGDFLNQFTVEHIGPQTGLPIVSLKALPQEDLRCPFVSDEGCQVYADRPASCRTYPLARAVSQSRDTGQLVENYALMQEPHCQGFGQKRVQTVREWIEDQEIEQYNRFNDMLMTIISLKNQHKRSPLDLREQHLFRLALYDLDAFRDHLDQNGFPEGLDLDESEREALFKDESKLLAFGHRWLQLMLFGQA
ncbi:MAG: YkgJ family cysteine cluster protein [Desulfobacterales bacterium]|nr:YkgJ family cysteine cluster protein [Desulfobacterales bacterium]MDJ0856155.1 YkgJ family cysteine cluster protein [Desulfobacterales bacterium]MDJ0991426.1 YkgJ family cysteine cluster protein [Desulfobacterales bacterium]